MPSSTENEQQQPDTHQYAANLIHTPSVERPFAKDLTIRSGVSLHIIWSIGWRLSLDFMLLHWVTMWCLKTSIFYGLFHTI